MTDSIVLDKLRRILKTVHEEKDEELTRIVSAREDVLNHYQPIFSPDHIPNLTTDEFKSFLLIRNNQHWDSIHRQGNRIVEDMEALRDALLALLDESRSIEERLRELRPKGREPKIKGLARSVITPILLVAYPTRYGVWNRIAATAMKKLGIFPLFERGADFATKYVTINKILLTIADELEIDLWTLDTLWWGIESQIDKEQEADPLTEEAPSVSAQFGLEKYLHEFLRDNWDHTELGQEWQLHEEDGEQVGYKFNTDEIGEIDLLARHKSEPRWLVIELKRGNTSDKTVGQALRYRGWVKRRLAQEGETVEALVIGHKTDPKLYFALEGVDGVSVLTYSVSFSLSMPKAPWEDKG